MPKPRLSTEEKELLQFNGFVLAHMKLRGLKQEDIADFLSLPRQSIGYRFSGKARWTLPEMIKICDFFDETYTIGTIKFIERGISKK